MNYIHGAFNLHIDNKPNPISNEFRNLLNCLDFLAHICLTAEDKHWTWSKNKIKHLEGMEKLQVDSLLLNILWTTPNNQSYL